MKSIGETIAAHEGDILAAWAWEAKKRAAARDLTQPDLMNLIPTYLRALGLGRGARNDQHRQQLVDSQISSRLRAGFDVEEVIDEFSMLGRVVAASWTADPHEAQPEFAETAWLFSQIEQALVAVTARSREHLIEAGERPFAPPTLRG